MFTAIHLFLQFFVGFFFLGCLSHGEVAVEYCDESMVKNSAIESSKEDYKSKADSLSYFSQIDQISHYCVRLQKTAIVHKRLKSVELFYCQEFAAFFLIISLLNLFY